MLKKRLEQLEKPFSKEWVTDFIRFMKIVKASPELQVQLEVLKLERDLDQKPLVDALRELIDEGKMACKEVLQKAMFFPDIFNEVNGTAERIIAFGFTKEEEALLCFDPLRNLYNYVGLLRELTEKLIRYEKPELTFPWGAVFCPMNVAGSDRGYVDIKYKFSKSVLKCQREMEAFEGRRDIAYWRKWDILLQWQDHPWKQFRF